MQPDLKNEVSFLTDMFPGFRLGFFIGSKNVNWYSKMVQ